MNTTEIKDLIKNYYSNINEDTATMFDINMKNSLLDSEGNLKDYISEKVFGIALYAVFNAVKKTREAEARKKIAEMNSCNEYFGEVGYKFKGHALNVTLTKINRFETQFGCTYIWNMKDKDGHDFVWFSSVSPYGMLSQMESNIRWNDDLDEETKDKKLEPLNKLFTAIENGSPVNFDIVGGSIKDHKEYTNRDNVSTKQTIVTRCKIDNWKVA